MKYNKVVLAVVYKNKKSPTQGLSYENFYSLFPIPSVFNTVQLG